MNPDVALTIYKEPKPFLFFIVFFIGAPFGAVLLALTIVCPVLWILFSITFFPSLAYDNVVFRAACILIIFIVSELWIFHRAFTKIIVFNTGIQIKSFFFRKDYLWSDIIGLTSKKHIVNPDVHSNIFVEKSKNGYLKLKSGKTVYLTNSQNKHYEELLMIIKKNLKNSYNEL